MLKQMKPFVAPIFAVALITSPLRSQGLIQFGAKLNGTFSGGEEVKELFVPFLPGSAFSYWELSQSFVQIDAVGIVGRSISTKAASIEFKGQIYFLTSKGQKHFLKDFSESTAVSVSPRGKAIFQRPLIFIQVANKGELRNVKTDSPFANLVVELVKPVSLKASFSQPQPFGFGE